MFKNFIFNLSFVKDVIDRLNHKIDFYRSTTQEKDKEIERLKKLLAQHGYKQK